MILAAGRGQRLRPLTDYVPKPLIFVGPETLAGRHLQRLARAGIEQVVINTAWLGQRLRVLLGDGRRYGLKIRYSDEGEQALETGGGIQRALPLLGPDPFLVVNGDVWTDLDFATVEPPGTGDLGTLVLVPNPPAHARGDFSLEQGRVGARPSGSGDAFTYSGIAALRPELFAATRPGVFPLAPLLQQALTARRLRGQFYAGAWFDTGSPASLQRARDHTLSAPA